MKLKGRKIYKGVAEGEAIVTKDGISFYGGVDPDTGKVVELGTNLKDSQYLERFWYFQLAKAPQLDPIQCIG